MPGVSNRLTVEMREHLQSNLMARRSYREAAEALNLELPIPGRRITRNVVSGLVFRKELKTLRSWKKRDACS